MIKGGRRLESEKKEELVIEENEFKKKKITSGRIVLIVVIAVVCVIAATAGTLLGNVLSEKMDKKPKSEAVETKYNKDEVSVPLEEFLVNLADSEDGETSYIRTEISLLTNNAKNAEMIETNKDLVRDSVINKLRQKDAHEILADKNGVNNLKEELRDQINKDYGSALVREVFITNLVIQ